MKLLTPFCFFKHGLIALLLLNLMGILEAEEYNSQKLIVGESERYDGAGDYLVENRGQVHSHSVEREGSSRGQGDFSEAPADPENLQQAERDQLIDNLNDIEDERLQKAQETNPQAQRIEPKSLFNPPSADGSPGGINYDAVNKAYGGAENSPFGQGPLGSSPDKPMGCYSLTEDSAKIASCIPYISQAKAKNQIVYLQPQNEKDTGAVIFNGMICPGVKRKPGGSNGYTHSNAPKASATEEGAPVYKDKTSRGSSANFEKGSYGDKSDEFLQPLWLGASGAIQIHSLRSLKENASVAQKSSAGCLVVNQNTMRALNKYVTDGMQAKFKIFKGAQDTGVGSCLGDMGL